MIHLYKKKIKKIQKINYLKLFKKINNNQKNKIGIQCRFKTYLKILIIKIYNIYKIIN